MRAVVFRHHHQAGRASIETVHDARPQLAADAAQVVHLVEQRVDQRALRVAGGGMDDHAGRLVDDDEIRVLIDDVEVEVLGLRDRAARLGNVDGDRLAGVHDAVGRHGVARNGDLAVFDETLNLRPRLAAEHARQIAIDADARFVGG